MYSQLRKTMRKGLKKRLGRSKSVASASDETELNGRALFGMLLNAIRDFSLTGDRELAILQIGANDGITNDPIHGLLDKVDAKVVLVEPQPDSFTKLKETYHMKHNFAFENAAICARSGSISMYRIIPRKYPEYRKLYKDNANPTGITSFDKNHVERFLTKIAPEYFESNNVNDWIEEISVKGITIDDLVLKYQIEAVDFVQVDAEGFDGEIIRMLLKSSVLKCCPRVLNFEYKNIPADDKKALIDLLIEHGYSLFFHGGDVSAFKSIVLN